MANILLGVTGSVAATLTPKLVRALKEIGSVEAVCTRWGEYFFNSSEVDCRIWRDEDEWWTQDAAPLFPELKQRKWLKKGDPVVHIDLRKWADILILAPLTANTMAKICCGICDNLLTSVVRAWDWNKPLLFAPAMNTIMWINPPTGGHVEVLQQRGAILVPPVSKELACGDEGEGAMARIETIAAQTCRALLPVGSRTAVEQDLHYFVHEGGADGTFSHIRFHAEHGEWAKLAAHYAALVLRSRGESW